MDAREQQLAEFREDLRRVGPDGTIPDKFETLGDYLKRLFPEPGDFVQCDPKYLDVMNKNMEELLA